MTSIKPDTAEKQNIALVTRFCKSWEEADVSLLLEFLDDTVFYQMWDADDAITIHGKAQFEEVVGRFLASMDTVEFDIVRTQCIGKIVINERTDRFTNGRGQMVFPVTGVFVVENGRIAYWKDYLLPGRSSEMPF